MNSWFPARRRRVRKRKLLIQLLRVAAKKREEVEFKLDGKDTRLEGWKHVADTTLILLDHCGQR